MDIRCENCQTEYEFDEAHLAPAGVTVKCAACGHLFKVRRRGDATLPLPTVAIGVARTASQGNPPLPAAIPNASRLVGAPPIGALPAAEPPASGIAERPWILRAPDGSENRLHELTTLQQWIVERRIGPSHCISRTGESWKPLGEIAELAAFFHVVAQAEAASRAAPSPPIPAVPPRPSAPPAPAPRAAESEPVVLGKAAIGVSEPEFSLGTTPVAHRAEPSFAMGNRRSAPSAEPEGWPDDSGLDDLGLDALGGRRRGLLWLFVLLMLAAGGAAAWLFTVGPLGRGRSSAAVPAAKGPSEAVRAAEDLYRKDTDTAFAAAEERLASEDPRDPWALSAEVEIDATWAHELEDDAWVARNVPPPASADAAAHDAELSSRAANDKLAVARQRGATLAALTGSDAIAEAQRALALVAVVTGSPASDVRARLDRAFALSPGDAGSTYVEGLLLARDGDDAGAIHLFQNADRAATQAGAPLVAARFELALAELRSRNDSAARQALQATLDASAGHLRAAHLLSLLSSAASAPATAPTTSAPPVTPPAAPIPAAAGGSSPPETATAASSSGKAAESSKGTAPKPTGSAGGSYASLVRDGDTQAVVGHEAQAKADYEKALENQPDGVEALVGLGRCYEDEHRFDEARARFDQAAAHGDAEASFALAELANEQGQAQEALGEYKKYLAAGASGDEAGIARRQVRALEERLGVTDDGASASPAPAPEGTTTASPTTGTNAGATDTPKIITVPAPASAP